MISRKWIHKAGEASKKRVVAHLEVPILAQIGEDMKAVTLQDGVGKDDILHMHMRFGHTANTAFIWQRTVDRDP